MNGVKSLASAVVLGSLVYFGIGLSAWMVGVVMVVSFLGLGGWKTTRLAIKTLPRDIRMMITYRKVLKDFEDWKDKTVSDVFSETVSRHPDKPAILFEDQCWTFRELDCFANKVAHFFLDHGLKKGDTVALFMENCPEFLGMWLGLGKIGVRSSFINYNLREAALLHCLNICHPKAIVYSTSVGKALVAVQGDLDKTLQGNVFSIGENTFVKQSKNLIKEVERVSTEPPPRPKDSSSRDYLCYIYTSGTTGLPKAVPLRNTRYFYLTDLRRFADIKPDQIIYLVLPLYHSNGGGVAAGQMIVGGCTLVLRRKFSASQFWNDCIKYKCDTIFYIGEVCRYLLAQPVKPTDTQHCIRQAVGNGLHPQIWTQFQERFKITKIYEFYGSTEGNCGMVNTTGHPGACGFNSVFLPFIEADIIKVDTETGKYIRNSQGFCERVGVNEPGEVIGEIGAAASESFDGYQDPAATKKKILKDVFKKGDAYFLSGDLMRMDEEGYLYFCDRIGDTFRWKGENVSTDEVEGIIGRLVDLRDVVVFGVDVPGAEGKAGMACIVGDEESVDVGGLAEKVYRALPTYAVPLFVRLIQQADLTGTYKFQKTRLRDEGYDIGKVSDPLFFLDTSKKIYVPLDEEKFQQLQKRKIRV